MFVNKLFIAVIAGMLLTAAHADWFDFRAITDNDPSGQSQEIGESQLQMEIVLYDEGQIRVLFVNEGPEESSVAHIYFDFSPDISLSLAHIGNGEGVFFTDEKVSPGNLPGGKSIFSTFESDIALGAVKPAPENGINPGESLELIMDYDGSYDVLTAVANESLRVGLHVISLGEYSESFVNVVPEPATLPLLLSGTVALRWLRLKNVRRYRSQDKPNAAPVATAERDELEWVEIHTGRDRRTLPLTRSEAATRKVMS